MNWVKVLLLAISLALNTHWVIAKQSATAYTDSTVCDSRGPCGDI